MIDALHIRHATAKDAEALARIGEQTFRDTFAAANTAEDMDLHCRDNYGPSIQAGEISNPDMLTLLAEAENGIIGFCQLRWGPAPPCVQADTPGEILRLYVLSGWHGRGIAQRLMEAALDALRQRGSDRVWLGVWEHNPRAIAFYGKYGFTEVGAHVFAVGTDPQRDLVMVRRVVSD
ncbi:GNAT family N-acetyltransferase [Arenimonas sp. GDDSR-1]|uniref:GNAT family N-acetyltransferase n=1 Tax=Arenimonas sp. GDDSR-1 TaxID=2950125 RepID=UPI002617E20E|nr:GNAT family N-acetyltransferase [Arenimonas sp. GDDSR-1]